MSHLSKCNAVNLGVGWTSTGEACLAYPTPCRKNTLLVRERAWSGLGSDVCLNYSRGGAGLLDNLTRPEGGSFRYIGRTPRNANLRTTPLLPVPPRLPCSGGRNPHPPVWKPPLVHCAQRMFASQTEGELKVTRILKEKFPGATAIKVTDISGGCGAMYEIQIESEEFKEKRTVQQHQMVNQALKEEIKGMHGLRIFTSVPKH
nr:bolA-like protein 3 [Vulpes vulpes]